MPESEDARRPRNVAAGRVRRPTMTDIAARVGVSQSLVSLIFRNQPGASAQTRERLGWHPTGPGLIADLERMKYD